MKILHVIPYSPVPPQFGAALRVYNLMKEMTRNHDLSVIYFGREGSERRLKESFGDRIRNAIAVPRPWSRDFRRLNQLYALLNGRSHFKQLGLSSRMAYLLRKELDSHDYDIVQTEFPNMASYPLETDAVKVLDAHNVEYDLNRRQGEVTASLLRKFHYREEARKLHREEIDAWRRQDLIFTTSERDKDLINADVPDVPTVVLPNGVDSAYFTPDGTAAEPETLVFTGVMRYLPNSDGVRWFIEDILPLIRQKAPAVKLL